MAKKTSTVKSANATKKSPAKAENLASTIKVPDSGWKILAVLWKRGECVVSQLECSLYQKTGWGRNTVWSLLNRLVKKGVVRLHTDEKLDRFEAVYDRDTMLFHEIEDLLEKCDADFEELVTVYLAHKRLPAQTVKNLKSLLAKYKSKL